MRRIVVYASVMAALALGFASATPAQAAPKCKFPNCEPTLTSGVETVSAEGGCTAGPMMIKTADPKETWVLEAGHCFTTTGEAVKAKWPSGLQATETIGKVTERIDNDKLDTGEVQLENAPWTLPPALITEWANTTTTAILGETAVTKVGEEVCHEGATWGHRCGEVIRLPSDKQCAGLKKGPKNLVETAVEARKGDSGGPYYKEKKGPKGELEGDEIVGTSVSIGEKYLEFMRGATFTEKTKDITGLSLEIENTNTDEKEKVEKVLKGMEELWPKRVPVGIPPAVGIKGPVWVTGFKEDKENKTLTVEMSAPVPSGFGSSGGWTVTFGYKELSCYEPMAQIKAVPAYAGQELLTKANESR
jgi:hypothetical protein